MVNWPKIEYEHIFAYFIYRLGTYTLYTREQLLSWKQLEAYNHFQMLRENCVVFSVWQWEYKMRAVEGKGEF